MKHVVALVLALGISTAAVEAVPLSSITVHVVNSTKACALITVSGLDSKSHWEIVRSEYIRANGNDAFVIHPPSHLPMFGDAAKVRAEITRSIDCTGGTVHDVWAQNIDIRSDREDRIAVKSVLYVRPGGAYDLTNPGQ